MKNLILSCLFALTLVSFTGCASDKAQTTTDTTSTMTVDSKDMHPRSH